MKDLKLAYLMSAKICHDIAAPLGAVGMGLESIQDDELSQMLMQSYFISNFKLRFYRLFMTSSENGPEPHEFISILNAYAKHQNIELTWSQSILDAQFIQGDHARFLMGFVYLLLETLIRGGICHVDINESGLILEASGPICKLKDHDKDVLLGESAPLKTARNIYSHLLIILLKTQSCHIELDIQSNAIKMTIS